MIPMSNRRNDSANQAYSSDHEAVESIYSGSNAQPYIQNQMNTTNVSYDLYGTNAPKLTTRYDLKSQSSISLYGSRKSLPVVVSVNPTEIKPSRKMRFKNYVLRKLFSDDDSYAEGEYSQHKDSNNKRLSKKGKTSKDARENWSGRCDFFLSCLGYAVGLGAVWRFPYLCYKNGGGVFLIPYFIFLFLVGIPLFFLELNLGQYTSQGAITCWKMAPIFKGLGISMTFASALLCIYYNMIIGYSIYYLVLSLRIKLDWTECDYAWATKNCTDNFTNFLIPCNTLDVVRDASGVCYTYSNEHGRTPIGWWNIQKRIEFQKPVLPTEDYWNNYVLQKTVGFEGQGNRVVWQLALCLLAAWALTFLCIFKGIKSSGKVVYFTALFPYVVLLILGIFGWTLPGADKGILFYLKPDLSRLLDANVWFDAAVQIFFIMSTSYGGLITLASYNEFNRNSFRDTFVIALANAFTSIFAGFVVFAFIGYVSYVTQQEVSAVVTSGPGLAFIIFPFAVTKLAGSSFWSFLFFTMLITLGLDSEFTTLETVITSILDAWPKLKKYKIFVILFLCCSFFLLGLPYCTRAGQHWIEIMDKFSNGWAILIIGFLECVCIGWVYGYKKFRKDIELMIGVKYTSYATFWFWIACWCAISPLLLLALIIFSWIDYKPLSHGNYIFPTWTNAIGWLITFFILSGTIFWAIYCIIDVLFINKRPFITLFTPEADWGPARTESKRLAVHLPNLVNFHGIGNRITTSGPTTPRDV